MSKWKEAFVVRTHPQERQGSWLRGPFCAGLQGAGSEPPLCGTGARGGACAGLSCSPRSHELTPRPTCPRSAQQLGSTPAPGCADDPVSVPTSARADLQRGWNVFPVAWRFGGQTKAERGGQDRWGGGAGGCCRRQQLQLTSPPFLLLSPIHAAPGHPVTCPHPPSLLAPVTLYLPVCPCPLTHVLDITCLLQRKKSRHLPK